MSTPALATSRIDDWLERLAAPVPEPGGGAAAGLVIATGAALAAMAAGYAAGAESAAVVATATAARRSALDAAEHDGRMSAALVAAFRRDGDDPDRSAAIVETTVLAARASSALVEVAASLFPALAWLDAHGESRLAPDVAVSARLLASGIRASAVNIRCDTTSAVDAGARGAVITQLRTALTDAEDAAVRLEALAERITATL